MFVSTGGIAKARYQNYLLNCQEREAARAHLDSKPIAVMLPTGSRCNLRCVMCVDRSNGDSFRDFSYEEFLKFVPAIDLATSIAIYGWGEPLINDEYSKIFDYIRSKYPGVVLHISTNGTLIDDFWVDRFVGTPNIFLNISINAATRGTYERIMGADCFDLVVENIRRIQARKERDKGRFPVITLSFVMLRENIHELPELVELGKELAVDDIVISDLMRLEQEHDALALGELQDDVAKYYSEAKSNLDSCKQDLTLTLFTDVPYLPTVYGNICTDPWESCKIAENGDVAICCYANRSFGNILVDKLDDIWNSDGVKHFRATVNSENPPAECQKCPRKLQARDTY